MDLQIAEKIADQKIMTDERLPHEIVNEAHVEMIQMKFLSFNLMTWIVLLADYLIYTRSP